MPARQESCCFTGHRPAKLPWGMDETDARCLRLKAQIADALEAAYQSDTGTSSAGWLWDAICISARRRLPCGRSTRG